MLPVYEKESVLKPGYTGFKRLFYAFVNAFAGLKAAIVNEAAFRQELAILVISIPLAIWIGKSVVEWILMIGVVMLLLIVELLNSAVEAVVDRVGPERHELSGRAKDLGAAAVLVTIFLAISVWLSIIVVNFFIK
jgi:diacylglycerol kinase (ATP)